MEYHLTFEWPQTKREAYAIQAATARQITLFPANDDPKLIAAVDSAYGFGGETIYVSAVVTTFPDIEEVERASYYGPITFPYVPGLLFFREGPTILKALGKLKTEPDLIIVHGHGIAHPKRCGMASHIGVVFDRPTIGCCRKLLGGDHREPAPTKGSSQPITLRREQVGWAYRSKDKVKPIFVSPGYKVDLDQARDIVVRNLRGYRLPEPLRVAHLLANKFKRYIERKNGPKKRPRRPT